MSSSLRFGVISDVHVTHFGEGFDSFRRALSVMGKYAPELLVFPGDTVYMLDGPGIPVCEKVYSENYDMVQDAIREALPGVPAFFCMGNHEFPQGNPTPELTAASREMYERKSGQTMCCHRVYGGYHFITAPVISWNMEDSPENEAYLMAEIDKALADDGEKPVFVVTHSAVHDTSFSIAGHEEHFSDNFRSFLTARPRVVYISGHFHTPVQDEGNIWQGGFTAVNCPVTGVGYIVNYHCEDDSFPTFGVSQGYLFDVSDGHVKITRLDFVTGREICAPWEFDAGKNEPYAEPRRERSETRSFAPGSVLTVKAEGDALLFTVPQRFTEGRYTVQFFDLAAEDILTGKTFTRRVPAEYWLTDMPETVLRRMPGLPAGKYRVSVRPVGSFGNVGAPLFAEAEIR